MYGTSYILLVVFDVQIIVVTFDTVVVGGTCNSEVGLLVVAVVDEYWTYPFAVVFV